jgi:hypothetical protein
VAVRCSKWQCAMITQYDYKELRILALKPIRDLPAYSADYAVTCSVGKAVAAHMEIKA